MHHLTYVACSDPSSHLGRFDYHSLPQQALMELLIDKITNKEKILGSQESSKDLVSWYGVILDDNGDVICIDWDLDLEGSLSLEWLPPSVQEVDIENNMLPGTIHCKNLPSSLVRFSICGNTCTCDVDFSNLPENLEELFLSNNRFIGSLNLESLPKLLQYIFAENNRFTGTLNLTQLPSHFTDLDVSENLLFGSIDLTCLPKSLEKLYLAGNTFSGSINLSALPEALRGLSFNDNNLEGETDFSKLPQTLEDFDISWNVDFAGKLEIDAVNGFSDLFDFNVSHTNVYGNIRVREKNVNDFKVADSKVNLIVQECVDTA